MLAIVLTFAIIALVIAVARVQRRNARLRAELDRLRKENSKERRV